MTTFSSPSRAVEELRPGHRVYVAGCFGEPLGFIEALSADPSRSAGVTFTGVAIPGVNRHDLSSFAPDSIQESFFVTPEMRDGFMAGRIRFLPLHYSQIVRHFRNQGRPNLGVMRVSPPNLDGHVSFGVAADFSPGIAALEIPLMAEIDPGMPFVESGPTVPLSRFFMAYEWESKPTYTTGKVSTDMKMIAGQIAALIGPGDTIQLGLGKVQKAVLEALSDHQGLAYHGGMIIDEIIPLVEGGVFRSVTTGVALGSEALSRFAAMNERIVFRPVSVTHDHAALSSIPNFVSINAALSVDLSGASVSDMLEGRQVSGVGGLVDFHRGAMASLGGLAIIALASTSSDGTVSRIVPALPQGQAATIARADAAIVVTEHGLVDCRGMSLDERARALISIAAPAHRESLADAWSRLSRQR